MRVAHVYKDVYPPVLGGIEKHIQGIRESMPDVTTDVIVCARTRRTSVERVGSGVEVRVSELGRVLSVPLAPTFPVWLARLPADVFHLHMPNPPGEVSALAMLRRRPYVASYHADVVRQAGLMPLYRPIADACLARAERVIVGSEGLGRSSPALERHRGRLELVPYAVDTVRFDPDAVAEDARAAVRERWGSPLVVSVGRLVHYKGFEVLIEAARSIGATVAIAGSGPLEGRLRSLAAGQPRVRLLGEVAEPELPALLGAADCFVLPSVNRAESFGVATLEAQAMGTPAVVTSVGTGTAEAIEPGVTGEVVPPGDPAALAAAVRSLLEHPQRRLAMGRAARERIVARHSLAAQARALRSIYAATASATPPARLSWGGRGPRE